MTPWRTCPASVARMRWVSLVLMLDAGEPWLTTGDVICHIFRTDNFLKNGSRRRTS